jgi:hypothetical protein
MAGGGAICSQSRHLLTIAPSVHNRAICSQSQSRHLLTISGYWYWFLPHLHDESSFLRPKTNSKDVATSLFYLLSFAPL